MSDIASDHLSKRVRRAIIAFAAIGITTAPTVHAKSPDKILVVPPRDLPELARQTGEAMLLRETTDGRAILYVEQGQGARLAIFDVTDPVHIKGKGSVQLGSPGTFDFVATVGSKQELIQFRQGREEAVLNFHNGELPNIEAFRGLTKPGPITRVGNDGLIVVGHDTERPSAGDYQAVDTASAQEFHSFFDGKQVRAEVSKADTGTTFLLADEGLYVVRRPAVESDKRRRDLQWSLMHDGA
jgi:hypothetical protein